MWKSIIIVTSLLMTIGISNANAAGLNANMRDTHNDRVDRNEVFENTVSFSDVMNSFNLSEDVSAGFIFGLNREKQDHHEGPKDTSSGMGIGVGLSFSF